MKIQRRPEVFMVEQYVCIRAGCGYEYERNAGKGK